MPQSTLDVIVGGLVAAIGGFLAILYVRWRDGVEAESRFKAAVLVTLDELGANEVNIEHLIGKPFGPAEFYDQTYRAMELTMATRLRPADRQLLAEAYAPTRSRWAAEQPGWKCDRSHRDAEAQLDHPKSRLASRCTGQDQVGTDRAG